MIKRLSVFFIFYLNLCIHFLCTTVANPLIDLKEIATGLSAPVYITHAGDGSNRLFIIEKRGRIIILKDGSLLNTPFLNIHSRVFNVGRETGFLGLAFHPDYKNNGRFFVNYTTIDKGVQTNNVTYYNSEQLIRSESEAIEGLKTVIAEYKVSRRNPDVAEVDEKIILEIDQPTDIHNGGQLQFGPDGFLYIGMGDGGPADDGSGNGQNKDTLLGAILRIDVDTDSPFSIPPDNPFADDDGADEIYAYGFRNPWRFSFDRLNERLFVGDVGQRAFEEVDLVEKGGNYGWSIMEGFHCFPLSENECDQDGLSLPIAEYSHDEGQAIIGGYVYRGTQIPELIGAYLFGDFSSGKIWYLVETAPDDWERTELLESGFQISSLGEDQDGELYLVDFGGSIFKIVPEQLGDSTPEQTPTPNPKSFTLSCDNNFLTGLAGLKRLVLELGESDVCVFRLSGFDPDVIVKVSTNLKIGLKSSISVDPIEGVINNNGELEFTISAIDKGIDWIAWAMPDENGEFKFDGNAYYSGRAWGMFVGVK